MKKVDDNVLTSNQFMYMLIGSMIAIGALSLPNDVIKHAKQDGWISAFLGSIYPFSILLMAALIQRKFPKDNILIVNKKCFGKILGAFLNLFLFLFFMIYLTAEISGLSNIIRTVIVNFLPPLKVYIVITFIGVYPVYKGLKTLGRINETIFYLILFMCVIPVAGILKGKIVNMCPVFGSGIINILKSSKDSAYQYAGMEMYLLLYPYVSTGKNLNKYAFKSIVITALIYTWLVFITIYSLGIDIIPKCLVSFPVVARYIEIPVINSFRFIFMALWTVIVINLISNYYYASVITLKSFIMKSNEKSLSIILYPFIIFFTTIYVNETIRRDFLNFIIPKLTFTMLTYILVTVIFAYIRKED